MYNVPYLSLGYGISVHTLLEQPGPWYNIGVEKVMGVAGKLDSRS